MKLERTMICLSLKKKICINFFLDLILIPHNKNKREQAEMTAHTDYTSVNNNKLAAIFKSGGVLIQVGITSITLLQMWY